MKLPNLGVQDQVKIETTIIKEQLLNSEKIPSNWSIKPLEGDQIEATNLNSGREFRGTVAEFNQFIKG